MRARDNRVVKFSETEVRKDILRNAKSLGIAEGAAEDIADRTLKELGAWAERRTAITRADLNAQIAKKIKKYNKDLAYVYQNRGKII